MKIDLKNEYIMVRSLEKKDTDKTTEKGIIMPSESLEDEQVASGVVVASSDEDYKEKDVLFFHKILPVDLHMKYNDDKLETFWFIHKKDIIFRVMED